MQRIHPHAGATYRIVPLAKEGTFGVEVVIPDTNPTIVTEFATEEAAETWISQHKSQVEANAPSRFQRNRGTHG